MDDKPTLVTYLELNQKHGRGYQARLIMDGVISSVIDSEPFTLSEAYSGAVFAIEEINKETGYDYDPYSVICVSGEAIDANKRHDFTTARVARDIQRGRGELSVPIKTDYAKKMVDGQEEVVMTGRGVVLLAYVTWLDDNSPNPREAIIRYCEYLAMHRYGGGTTEILEELDSMDKERGMNWIKATYGKYVTDDSALINHVMGDL